MSTTPYQFKTDVAIIGAGPAGAATSLFLAKKGIKHTLFDLAVFPRDKVCGDALSGKAVKILKHIDSQFVADMQSQKNSFLDSWGITFIAPNGSCIDIPFKQNNAQGKETPGFIAKRIDFDNFLINQLDANFTEMHLGTRVTDLVQSDEGIEIHYQTNGEAKKALAKMIVGAEGSRSIAARKLAGHTGDPNHFCSAIRGYYKNVKGNHPQNFIELYFLEQVLPGYFWIFPLPNNMANVGVGVLSANVKKKNLNLKEALQKVIAEHPMLKERFKEAELVGGISGWGLPLGSRRRNLSGERFLLVGDAASLIDPFSGEGIGNALVSAMIGAEVIETAVSRQDFSKSTLEVYDRLLYEKLWDELKLSYIMQRLGQVRWLFNLVVNRAKKSQTLRDTISCMFEDLNMRAMLRSPAFYLRLLFNL